MRNNHDYLEDILDIRAASGECYGVPDFKYLVYGYYGNYYDTADTREEAIEIAKKINKETGSLFCQVFSVKETDIGYLTVKECSVHKFEETVVEQDHEEGLHVGWYTTRCSKYKSCNKPKN